MKRRHFIEAAAVSLGAPVLASSAAQANDEAAARYAIENVYTAFYQLRDKAKYRALLTDDYLLLENGEVLDIEGDMALMPPPGGSFKRTDSLNFRSTNVHDNTAYVVYFLESAISDEKGARHRRWLESAVLWRTGRDAPWRIALLHSTRIENPAG